VPEALVLTIDSGRPEQSIFSLKATLLPGEEDTVRAILDTCAKSSFITRATVEKYGIANAVSQNHLLRGIGAQTVELPLSTCKFRLFSVLDADNYVDVDAYVIDQICDPITPMLIKPNEFPPLPYKTVTEIFPRTEPEAVDVLLSAAVMSQIWGESIAKCGPNSTVIMLETKLGQGIGGVYDKKVAQALTSDVSRPTNDKLSSQLKQFWNWETLGIRSEPERVMSKQDKFAVEHLDKHLRFFNQHYQVSLPFLPELRKPLNNFNNVYQMFLNLEKSLVKSKAKYDAYVPAFESFIENNFLELVPKSREKKSQNCFYLPHFAVFRAGHQSTAVRVVKNAAATDRTGVSLNSVLAQGPLLLHDLFQQLLIFRQYNVPFAADITKLFLMIEVAEKDRDFLRLLWRKPGENEDVKTYRMRVLPFGLNCSPFLAQAVIQKHIDKYAAKFPRAVELLRVGLYCDDLLGGASTEKEAIQLRKDVQKIMSDASMQFRKWLSSSKKFMTSVPEELREKAANRLLKDDREINDTEEDMPKTLGVCWNPSTDTFNFQNVDALLYENKSETMRTLASRAAKLYDPLGLIAPVTIVAKALMQECYKAELKWDSELPDHILKPWNEWKAEIHLLKKFALPRYVLMPEYETLEIHSFSDASEVACAAVVYLRAVSKNGQIKTTLVASKTKLSPLKTVTIPRLELLAAELGAKLVAKVRKVYNANRTICWIDSLSVLQWLNKPPSHWKTYVGNRVAAITEIIEPEEFRYCPTHENIADLPSRGAHVTDFLKNSSWTKGPCFLEEDEELWPELPDGTNLGLAKAPKHVLNEEKSPEFSVLVTEEPGQGVLAQIFTTTRPFLVGLRVFCWVKRFITRHKTQVPSSDYITAGEMRTAQQNWTRYVQSISFAELIGDILAEKSTVKSSLNKLQPFVDESGLLRVGGRIAENSQLNESTVHPAILPKANKFVEQFVLHVHRTHAHAGPETCLFIIKQRYWPVGGRREIKRILRCCSCYKLRAKPFFAKMAPLPPERLTPVETFINVGLDTFGPFEPIMYIQKEPHSLKTYAIIFTCLVTRAVHLEIVYDMSTLEFLNAFERFVSTRGMPLTIVCDNQTAFQKASKQLQRLYVTLDWDRIAKWCSERYEPIEIKFNVPLSPWRGGVFERMIGSVKKAMRATIGTKTLTLSKLTTLLKSAESVINQRPLTYVHDETDAPTPLSPDMILIGRRLGGLPDSLANDATASKTDILWKQRQKLQSEFGVRFQREYITTLLEAQKWLKQGQPPRVGEVVLVHKEARNRMFWPTAIVTQIHHGRDNLVRSCTLRLRNGDYMKRPVQLLLRLEAVEPTPDSRLDVDNTARAQADYS
jgi:hypothetical protein